jgi:hypothetical protein
MMRLCTGGQIIKLWVFTEGHEYDPADSDGVGDEDEDDLDGGQPELEIAVEIDPAAVGEEVSAGEDSGSEDEVDGLEELDELNDEDDEDIDDDEADMEEGEEVDAAWPGHASAHRHHHATEGDDDDEDEDGEDQEGDIDEGEEGDEDGDAAIDGHMDYGPEDEGDGDYGDDDYAAQVHDDDEGDAGDGDHDDDGAGMAEEDHFWNGGEGIGRVPAASRFRAHDDGDGDEEYVARSRSHDRNRRLSQSQGAHNPLHHQTLTSIIDSIRNQHGGGAGSGVFSVPGGAMITGGLLQTDDGRGGGETIAFDQNGGMTSRRVFLRGDAHMSDLLTGGSGDIGANISALLSNILPPNVSMTTSTARVDPRTGALTFSIGGTRTDHVPPSTLSATAVQPPAHPLLTVTDARRNRFLQPCVNGLATAFAARTPTMRSGGGMSLLGSGGSSTFDASARRGQVSARRREVGPIVSDRRWGTDIGDLEPAGARLGALTSAVEAALGAAIQREPAPEQRPRTSSLGKASREPLFGFRRLSEEDGDETSPPALGGTHYESDEDDEDGDGAMDSDSDGEGSDDAEARSASRRFRLGYDPNETKEEEGELQETKEAEPTARRSAVPPQRDVPDASSSSAANNAVDLSGGGSAARSSDMEVEQPQAAVAVAAAEPAVSAPPAVEDIAAPAAAEAPPASSVVTEVQDPFANSENLMFVESLGSDLREEVLLSAEPDFLRSLPRAIQDEARALRRSAGLIEPEEIAPALPSVTVPVTAAGATAAPEVALLDFHSLLQQAAAAQSASSTAPAAVAPEAPRAAASASTAASAAASAAPAAASSSRAGLPTSAAPAAAAAAPSGALELLRSLVSASSAGVSWSNVQSQLPAPAAAGGTSAAPVTAATAVDAPVPAVPTLEERRAAEMALTVSLGEDRLDATLPYGAHLVARLLRSFLMSNKSKLPRSVSKLLATACRYKHGRQWIIRALFGSLTHRGQRVAECVQRIPLEPESNVTSFKTELDLLSSVVDVTPHTTINVHRIISGMSFLFRRTDRLAWYDIMLPPPPQEDSVWLFGSLVALLADPVHTAGENLEYLLQVMEELCGVFSKLNVKQANELAAEGQRRLNAMKRPNGKIGRSVSYAAVGGALDTIAEEAGEEQDREDLPKRRRLEPASPGPAADAVLSPASRARAASVDIVSEAANSTAQQTVTGSSPASAKEGAMDAGKEEPLVPKDRHRMPFPVLNDREAKLLCQVAGSPDCNGNARKRLMRVMRYLSLCDNNWMLFLDHLATVGADLAGRATREFSDLREVLVEVMQNNETAAAAMARPELSTPKGMSEVRLLSVLRIMTALRSRSTESAAAEAEVVAPRVRRIQASSLWESLCDCLDIVRDLEGIKDTSDEVERGHGGSNSSSSAEKPKKEEEKEVALSSLTLRFMPLIECFLSVCATTMLVRPDKAGSSAFHETQRELERLSSGFKRRHSRDDAHGAISSSAGARLPPSTPGAVAHADIRTPDTINRVNSMLPGSRFRQHQSYFQMQMELSDEAAAERLITFATQNRVLFNNVLRNNVSLLETSFSPLVSVPRCRQLLHFDIKRAYFKLKLKRMRQSSNRAHGSLRLSVRRSGVFEESFQALRYKTADEMRRRLSVTFHGEEGMDAGGLTREWYGVLAREIFNPNYALFTSTGDNVTFQPNAQSYINPEHISYFKFVGRIIGKAICDGQLLDAHFTRSFYKHILGLPVSVVDLEAIDPEYFKSLKQILETPLDLLGLDLTFSAESNDFGVVSIVDLIPQGRDVPVTDDTKHEYVKLLAHHRMTTAIRKQVTNEPLIAVLPHP